MQRELGESGNEVWGTESLAVITNTTTSPRFRDGTSDLDYALSNSLHLPRGKSTPRVQDIGQEVHDP